MLAELTSPRSVKYVRAVASKYAHAQDIDDAVQETMFLALKNMHLFRSGNFLAWLGQITHNHIVSMKRRPGVIEYRSYFKEEEHPLVPPLDDGLREELQRALDILTDDDRRLLLDLVCGYTPEECSKTFGISVGATRSRFHRIRNQLKSMLENTSC